MAPWPRDYAEKIEKTCVEQQLPAAYCRCYGMKMQEKITYAELVRSTFSADAGTAESVEARLAAAPTACAEEQQPRNAKKRR